MSKDTSKQQESYKLAQDDKLREALEKLKKEREQEKLERESAQHPEESIRKQTKHAVKSSPVLKFLGRTKDWLSIRKNTYKVLAGFVTLLVIVFVIPTSRYATLNTLGVRASVDVYVVDEGTGLPLRNVAIKIADVEKLTNKEGRAVLSSVRLGKQVVEIAKLAYAGVEINIDVTTGHNELGVAELRPTGSQYQFVLSSWLSGEVIENGEVSYKENSVFSNDEGVALLTIPPVDENILEVTITADGYLEKKVTLRASQSAQSEVPLVIDANHFYISKRSGKYNLYKTNVDGSEEEVALEGTGKETFNLQLLTDESLQSVFYVSSRDGKTNADGSRLYTLLKIDSETFDIESIDESESIRIYGVSAERLIYVKVAAGQSGASPERQQIVSYDPNSGESLVLAKSNYFNSILLTDNAIYYAPSDLYKSEKMPYLFKADPLSLDKITVHGGEVWSIFRTGLNELTFDAKQDWYKVGIGAGSVPIPLNGKPAENKTILYSLNKDKSTALWVDNRDSKGYLVATDTQEDTDKTIHAQAGLRYPLRWADENHIIYRVVTSTESADYVIDIRGGEAKPIADVSNVPSFERWYYYY